MKSHQLGKPGAQTVAESIATIQRALVWRLAPGAAIVPIPGTKPRSYLEATLPAGMTAEERYPAQTMQAVNR